MLPKAIFILLRALIAKKIPLKVGEKFYVPLAFDGCQDWLSGTVLQVVTSTYGTLVLARNDGWKNLKFMCSGWEYLPIWLSPSGAGSGVVAIWKEQMVNNLLNNLADCCKRAEREMIATMVDIQLGDGSAYKSNPRGSNPVCVPKLGNVDTCERCAAPMANGPCPSVPPAERWGETWEG